MPSKLSHIYSEINSSGHFVTDETFYVTSGQFSETIESDKMHDHERFSPHMVCIRSLIIR